MVMIATGVVLMPITNIQSLFFFGSSAEFVQVIRLRKIPKVMQQSEFRNA